MSDIIIIYSFYFRDLESIHSNIIYCVLTFENIICIFILLIILNLNLNLLLLEECSDCEVTNITLIVMEYAFGSILGIKHW